MLAFSFAMTISVALARVTTGLLYYDYVAGRIGGAHLFGLAGGHSVRVACLWVFHLMLPNQNPGLSAYVVDNHRVKAAGAVI